MNPIDLKNNNYASYLEANINRKCTVRVLGIHGFEQSGMLVGIAQCTRQELTGMAGFIADVPIYKICLMAISKDGIKPVWINTLLIDDINDIQFL